VAAERAHIGGLRSKENHRAPVHHQRIKGGHQTGGADEVDIDDRFPVAHRRRQAGGVRGAPKGQTGALQGFDDGLERCRLPDVTGDGDDVGARRAEGPGDTFEILVSQVHQDHRTMATEATGDRRAHTAGSSRRQIHTLHVSSPWVDLAVDAIQPCPPHVRLAYLARTDPCAGERHSINRGGICGQDRL
jgi:hypothetical protein